MSDATRGVFARDQAPSCDASVSRHAVAMLVHTLAILLATAHAQLTLVATPTVNESDVAAYVANHSALELTTLLDQAKKDVENAEAVRLKMVSVLDELVQAAERDLKTRVHASLRTLDAARDAADEKVAVLKAAIVTAGAPASATRADE